VVAAVAVALTPGSEVAVAATVVVVAVAVTPTVAVAVTPVVGVAVTPTVVVAVTPGAVVGVTTGVWADTSVATITIIMASNATNKTPNPDKNHTFLFLIASSSKIIS
jgi:hypothetical protein